MPELFIIGVVALVVLGPERLPEVMGKIGRTYRQLRQMSDQVLGEARAQWEAGMREVEDVSSTINNTWQAATTDTVADEAPPRLRQLPPPMEAPDTAVAAGPWVLPAWHRSAATDVEPKPARVPASPVALEPLEPADYSLSHSLISSSSSSGPMLTGMAPTPDELAEWDALTSDLLPTREGSTRSPDLPSGRAAESTRPADSTTYEASARHGPNGRASEAPSSEREDGANGSVADAVREQTIVELYRQGGISLDRAAGFLEMTSAEFLEHVEGAGRTQPTQG